MGMIIKEKHEDGSLVLERETGRTFDLSEQEVWDLRILLNLEALKADIHEDVDFLDESGWIALGSFDGTQEEFEKEVYDKLENEVSHGPYPSEDLIESTIYDIARAYGIKVD